MKKRYNLLSFLITMLLMMSVSYAEAGNVRITLETPGAGHKIGVGETFYIIITATNCPGQLDVPGKPSGAVVLYNSSSKSVSTVSENGRMSQSVSTTMTLTCKAAETGRFSFGPVKVGDVSSNRVSYEITAGAQSQAASGQRRTMSSGEEYDENEGPKFIGKGNDEIFLKASVSKTSAYEQEAIVYTVKLYTTYEPIKFLGATAAPKFDGFVVEESKAVSSSLSFEQYNGKTYAIATIARYIIFPQKTGKLKIQGNTYTVSTDARQYYHDPFFQTLTVKRPVQLNVTPNDLVVDVRALPSPAPAGFTGAVGSYSITSRLPSQKYLTNTAASIVYTVDGTGNVKYVKMPELNDIYPEAIEVYSPNVSTDASVGASEVSGKAVFDYTFVPMETGGFHIPDVKFVYFDPASGSYKTSVAKGYDISVGRGEASEKSQKTLRFEKSLMDTTDGRQGISGPYVKTWWYWLFYIVPTVALAVSLWTYRRYLAVHADIAGLKSRRAAKMAMRRLRKAEKCMKAGNEDAFYDEMLSALWGYLGDKLKMPTSELTRQNVTDVLLAHGISMDVLTPMLALLDDCEFAKYADSTARSGMKEIYARGVEAIESVDSEFSNAGKNNKEEKDEEI